MSKAGQNNQRGILAQNLAAMLLFLQFLRKKDFLYIQLEPDNSEDFDLFFKGGKRIVCEVKYWSKKFSCTQLKELLGKIINRNFFCEQDEIIVICKAVDNKLLQDIKNASFFEKTKSKLKKAGFDEQMISLLPAVDFWIFDLDVHQYITYSLASELINIWVPKADVKRFVNDIIQNKIAHGSSLGQPYSREDFEEDISVLKKQIHDDGDYFNKKRDIEEQLDILEKELSGNATKLGSKSLSVISIDWNLKSFVINRLRNSGSIKLRDWDALWVINKPDDFLLAILNIFKSNIFDEENKKYILEYIKIHMNNIVGYYRPEFFLIDLFDIFKIILDNKDGERYLEQIFNILENISILKKDSFLFLKSYNYHNELSIEQDLCKLLYKSYEIAGEPLKNKIINFIRNRFNIVNDSAPSCYFFKKGIYDIFQKWLEENFIEKFPIFLNIIIEQYDDFYEKFSKKQNVFKGWDTCGSITTFFENNYNLYDRCFICYILIPSIENFYHQDVFIGWNFIKEHCISNGSREKPDFLNRAVYQIIIKRYMDDNREISEEAFELLKKFILSEKGIPRKDELIYQSILSSDMSDEKKWELVKLSLGTHDSPRNIFVEKNVSALASRGHQQARDNLNEWFFKPDYYSNFMLSCDYISTMQTQLITEPDFAVELFKSFITSEYAKSNQNDDKAYYMAGVLRDILQQNYENGLSIFKLLNAEKVLSIDQQIIYTASLFKADAKMEINFLLKIYRDIVSPLLGKNNGLQDWLSHPHSRENLVHFAGKLADIKEITGAMRIIRAFIDDPDPYSTDENLDDIHKNVEKPDFVNSSQGGAGVRGWCGWVLMKCAVLEGREYIPEIIKLSKKLVEDKNHSVISMGCLALEKIAKNRLTVLPEDKGRLFFNDDKKTALQMAKNVELIVFELLSRFALWPYLTQKKMAKDIVQVLSTIRTLTEKDALLFVKILNSLPEEIEAEFAHLLIYYAEFRKNSYANWKLNIATLYDDLSPDRYDDRPFKKNLIERIQKIQEVNPDSCFNFTTQIEYVMREMAENKNKMIEGEKFALKYFNLLTHKYSYSTFNLVYAEIENKISASSLYTEWFDLLIQCLQAEKLFYDDQVQAGNGMQLRSCWILHHSNILELVYHHKQLGGAKFIQAAEFFFFFPKEVNLCESEKIISILTTLVTNDSGQKERAKNIINKLCERNPSAYFTLKKELLNKGIMSAE